tara:strand:- start:8974 stop:9585 length:612 start_codon:yes stop_codon:yes gene_type:complete
VYKNALKPILDTCCALVFFIVLSPIFLGVMVALWVATKGTPFFFQARPGKKERIFKIIKFKTMSDEKDASGALLPDAQRLTAIGRWVRSASLDEIPQLLNVIKGDMSLVGPRPLLPEYLPLYNDIQRKRHEVRPGITGYAQVHGRNAISWERKFELDVYYVKHQSFLLDVNILWKTLFKVFLRKDINTENTATTIPFKGTSKS